jgi:hypothetical protein
MTKDIQQYEKWYDPIRFTGGGLSWTQWRKKKEATFAAAKTISVQCQLIDIMNKTDSTATIRFIQRYASNTLQSDNGKQLDFTRTPDGWKIYRESVFPKEEHRL